MIDISGVEINDEIFRDNSKKAVIDSGTSYLLISLEALNFLWRSISKYCSIDRFSLDVICACPIENIYKYPVITIYSLGWEFKLEGKDYLIKTNVFYY